VRARGGAITIFDVPGAGTGIDQGTNAVSINRDGTIVGQYTDAANVYHGFVRASDGTISTYDSPGVGTGAYQGTLLAAISALDEIVGLYIDANKNRHSFILHPDGSIRSIDLPGATGTLACCINTVGQVGGIGLVDQSMPGFIWTP
jgi:hypothetical protein